MPLSNARFDSDESENDSVGARVGPHRYAWREGPRTEGALRPGDLNLRLLRYFVVLAEELHFGRAARRLNLTQSPLSKAIQQLEDELGMRLFERDSRKVVLTAFGHAMLGRAHETLLHARNTVEFAKSISSGRVARIEVGFTAAMLFRSLGDLVKRFQQAHPRVELSLKEGATQRLIEFVRGGALDAGFVNSPVAPPGLESLGVFRERYVACVPARHRLAGAPRIVLSELKNEPFLSFNRAASSAYHDHVMGLCAAAGFEPQSRKMCDQILTQVALVASGFGVAVVPESIERAGLSGVRFVPLAGTKPLVTSYLVWNRERCSPGLDAFVETVRRTPASGRAVRRLTC